MTIRSLRCDEIASLVHLCGEHAGGMISRVLGNGPQKLGGSQ